MIDSPGLLAKGLPIFSKTIEESATRSGWEMPYPVNIYSARRANTDSNSSPYTKNTMIATLPAGRR